jgi:PAS domain S-box-containing protein
MTAHDHSTDHVSCRATGYAIQALTDAGLPTAHLTTGLDYTLDELRVAAAAITWDEYLIFFRNVLGGVTPEQFVALCSSYQRSAYTRPLLTAVGLWFNPARYFEWLAGPTGAWEQLFRCLETHSTRSSNTELLLTMRVRAGFAPPPDEFWQAQTIALAVLPTHFGLAPAAITREPVEGGAAFRVRLPGRRPVRFVLSWLASWFRRDTAADVRSVLVHGHERSLRLEHEIAERRLDQSERKRIESALRESEARLNEAQAIARIGSWWWEPGTGRTWWSDTIFEVYGISRSEVVPGYESYLARVHPEDHPTAAARMQRVLDGAEGFADDLRIVRPNGDIVWIHSRGRATRAPDGRLIRLEGTDQDITDRKRAEAEALAARDAAEQALGRLRTESARAERFQRLVEMAGQGVGMSLLDGSLTYLNPFFRRLLDIPPDRDITRQSFWDYVPPESHPFLAGTVVPVARAEGAWTGELDLLAAGGRRVQTLNNLVLLRDADGAAIGFSNIATDISTLKRTEAALVDAEHRQRLALDTARMGTWDWDIDRDRVVWDARQQELFGFGPGEYDGHPETFFTRIDPADAETVRQKLEVTIATGCPYEAEFRAYPRPGERRWVFGRGQLLADADGTHRRIVGINYDITDRVRAEERVRASLQEKEALLKEIHHRVKNNLQVISSLLNLQAERIAEPAARAVFLESQSRVRAMALVHETLYGSESLARIELPRYLERLCDSLLQTFGGADRITLDRQVADVSLDLDRALPAGLIVSELVSNALKYAFPDGRRGRIVVGVAGSAGTGYTLAVGDDGVGLPDSLDLDHTTSLGLYLVRVLVRQLRGHLTVDRSGGTTFTIEFSA